MASDFEPKVIDGDGGGPRPWRRRSLEESEQITCSACELAIGVASSATVEVRLAPRRAPDGKIVGGTRIVACALCLARGVITEFARLS
jgi:hypothetical protein